MLIKNVSKFKWPVHNSIDNPEIWDSNGRIVLGTYNNTCDIRVYQKDSNFMHYVTITIKDGRLHTRVSEQVHHEKIDQETETSS